MLDITMNEDACQIYRGNAVQLLADVCHMALNMLRLETSKKASIRRKQKMTGMNVAYLQQVIVAGIRGAVKN